jgi:hypothetical protein
LHIGDINLALLDTHPNHPGDDAAVDVLQTDNLDGHISAPPSAVKSSSDLAIVNLPIADADCIGR